MRQALTRAPTKWRPSVALVVGLVCLVLVSVPVLALLAMRLTSNQFVRETEHALIDQAAIYATVYAGLLAEAEGRAIGPALPEAQQAHWQSEWHPWIPVLNLRHSPILPPLPDFDEAAPPTVAPPGAAHAAVIDPLLALARAAMKTTLAGAFFLDHRGVNLRPDRLRDLSFAPEVQMALEGRVGTALRDRGDVYKRHPLTSISRDTWYRVFVAYPVIVEDRVAGVVYLSRTPSSFAKFLHTERGGLAAMLGATLLAAAIVGTLLWRLLSRPVMALSAQASRIASGQLDDPEPLAHYGVRELATLGQNVMRMAKTLTDRSRQVRVYTDHVTHELKSPVTAIQGAAELLSSEELPPETQTRLLDTIEGQSQRMTTLLEKLRHMTRLRGAPTTGQGRLAEMLPDLPGLSVVTAGDEEVPMLPEHGQIVLTQLAGNAADAGATRVEIAMRAGQLTVQDNGPGIPAEHLARVTEPFFTTRRETGGTGLGLAIVEAILQNYGAALSFETLASGTCARIDFRT